MKSICNVSHMLKNNMGYQSHLQINVLIIWKHFCPCFPPNLVNCQIQPTSQLAAMTQQLQIRKVEHTLPLGHVKSANHIFSNSCCIIGQHRTVKGVMSLQTPTIGQCHCVCKECTIPPTQRGQKTFLLWTPVAQTTVQIMQFTHIEYFIKKRESESEPTALQMRTTICFFYRLPTPVW